MIRPAPPRIPASRRRYRVHLPLVIIGGLMVHASFPTFNSLYLIGLTLCVFGAAAFVTETGK